MLAWSPTGTFGTPSNGTTYTAGDVITGGGTVLYAGSAAVFSHSGLTPETDYFYKAFSFDGTTAYSVGMTADATTSALPVLAVTPPNQNVSPPSGNTAFSVTSNTGWTVTSDQTWCSVDPSGTGNGTITAVFAENLIPVARIASITVTVNGLTPITVTVTQAGALPTLLVTPPDQPVNDPAGNTTFDVSSNSDWSVTSDQTWCTVTSSGTGNGQITADYLLNPSINQRIANIIVTVGGLTPVNVTVTQAGAAPMLSVTPPNQPVSSDAGTLNYVVTSNVDWTASSDSAWCSVTQSGTGNGTIVADYLENPYHSSRVATISVTGTGLMPQLVTVSQSLSTASVPELLVNGMRIYPNPAKGLLTVAVDKAKYPNLEVSLLDLAGTKVINRKCSGEKEYRFDLTSVPQGCYFVRIDTGRDIMVKKLVIIR